jgi:hypothetical protein
MLTDPAAWQAQFAARIQADNVARMNAAAAPLVQNNVETTRFMSQMDPKYKDVWAKWGMEIEREVMSIPAHMRTKALYDKAAQIVKSNHLNELIKAGAQQLVSSGAFGVEGSGGSAAPEAQADAEVWSKLDDSAMGQAAKSALGTNYKSKIRKAVDNMEGETIESYVKKLAGSKAKMDPLAPGTWRTELK